MSPWQVTTRKAGQFALLLRQIARDLLSLSHISWWHMDCLYWTTRQHWWEQVDNMLVDLHLSETNGSSWARTWTARLTDVDAKYYAISLPLVSVGVSSLIIYKIVGCSECGKVWLRNSNYLLPHTHPCKYWYDWHSPLWWHSSMQSSILEGAASVEFLIPSAFIVVLGTIL